KPAPSTNNFPGSTPTGRPVSIASFLRRAPMRRAPLSLTPTRERGTPGLPEGQAHASAWSEAAFGMTSRIGARDPAQTIRGLTPPRRSPYNTCQAQSPVGEDAAGSPPLAARHIPAPERYRVWSVSALVLLEKTPIL